MTQPIPEYVNEERLGVFLRNQINSSIEHNRQVPKTGERFRPDYRLDDINLIVEFDGAQHYTRASQIFSDRKKDRHLVEAGYRVVRLPYFVQLDSLVIEILFGIKTDSFNSYPHGFIDQKATLPCDYCGLGIARFLEDLDRFSGIRAEIVHSLHQRPEMLEDWQLVLPPQLRRLIL